MDKLFKRQGYEFNLFGESEQETKKQSILESKFLVPPFSVFDTKQGYWQDRKKQWVDLGIKSELGRDATTFNMKDWADKKRDEGKISGNSMPSDTSIFDPVVCELCYKWFCPTNGNIFDPFSGGSVRGIVAKLLGFNYTGIDLSSEQIKANYENAQEIPVDNINWINDDSMNLLNHIEKNTQDLIFTCPPYFDLEVYSQKDNDLSNMTWEQFKDTYKQIIEKANQVLKDDRFFIIVIGDIRNKKTGEYMGLVNYTKQCLIDCGLKEWNEIILLNQLTSAGIRAAAPFNANRKTTKVHQNILIFYKGDSTKIKENYKELDFNY